MYKTLTLAGNSSEGVNYAASLSQRFATLPKRNDDAATHIVVCDSDVIVAGLTLENFSSLTLDDDIKRSWEVAFDVRGTRALRLWSERQNLLPTLFDAVTTHLEAGTFLYGLLSLPTEAAAAYSIGLRRHWLKPRFSFNNASAAPTSEGLRLVRAYLKGGAHFLGPASYDHRDRSAKIVMGAYTNELTHVRVRHAEADL